MSRACEFNPHPFMDLLISFSQNLPCDRNTMYSGECERKRDRVQNPPSPSLVENQIGMKKGVLAAVNVRFVCLKGSSSSFAFRNIVMPKCSILSSQRENRNLKLDTLCCFFRKWLLHISQMENLMAYTTIGLKKRL